VTNNIFNNNEYGISLVTSGGVLIAHNLFLSSKKADIHTHIFNRTTDKWDSLNIEILYNIFVKSPQYLQLTVPLDGVSTRYMNYNQYNGTSKQEKFQLISIDGKTKTNMTLEKWQNTWSKYNSETNFDDKSYITVLDGELEEGDPGLYSVTMNTTPLLLSYISRTDITDDYFLKAWNQDNCIAGPFSELANECFQLNKGFVV
jgi:parallel beta-helix repeat protein